MRGHSFTRLVVLVALPDPSAELILVVIKQSVEWLVAAAFTSITTHHINEFD